MAAVESRVAALWIGSLLLVVLAAAPVAVPVAAQSDIKGGPPVATRASTSRVSLAAQSAPLHDVLESIATQGQVNLVYNTEHVARHRVDCRVKAVTVDAALTCALARTPLRHRRRPTGTFVIVTPPRPRTGRLTGTVVDAETGTPLPYASVFVASRTGTATDQDGTFDVGALAPGTHAVRVSYVGYTSTRDSVQIRAGRQTAHTIRLEPFMIESDPVYIDGMRFSSSEALAVQAVGTEQLAATSSAGTSDLARTAESLMGVSNGRPTVDLRIQGSRNGEHQMRLDGVPIRNPVSLGRLISAFSPLALGGLTTYKAGFGALHGSHLSGVLEVDHDLKRRGTKVMSLRVDPISVNGRFQAPLSSSGDATLMGAVRLGTWDVYQDPSLEWLINEWSSLDPVLTRVWGEQSANLLDQGTTTLPHVTFYDVHGAARVPTGETRYLYVSGYHGSSDMGADLVFHPTTASADGALLDFNAAASDAPQLPSYDRYIWSNTAAQARHAWMHSPSLTTAARGYVSSYTATSRTFAKDGFSAMDEAFQAASMSRPGETNSVQEVGMEGEAEWTPRDNVDVDLSLGATWVRSRFRVGNAFIPTLAHHVQTTRWTGATHVETALSDRTTLETGLRLTLVNSRQAIYAEPRLALRHEREVGRFGNVAARVAGGLYRQYMNQFDVSRDGASAVVPSVNVWLPVDPSLAPPRAFHLTTDVAWSPSDVWTVTAEGYAKWQPTLLTVDYPALRTYALVGVPESEHPLTQSSFITTTRGRVYGGGVKVAYEGDWMQTALSYTRSDARQRFPQFQNQMLPTPWNEPHRVTLEATVPVTSGLSVTMSGTGVWGRTWGYRQAYYDYLSPLCFEDYGPSTCTEGAGLDTIDPGHLPGFENPGADRLPPLYHLNAGFVYDRSWSGIGVRAELKAVNVLNRYNVAEWQMQRRYDGSFVRDARTLPGFRPVLSLQFSY